jgi:hypothetical protein
VKWPGAEAEGPSCPVEEFSYGDGDTGLRTGRLPAMPVGNRPEEGRTETNVYGSAHNPRWASTIHTHT